MNEFARRTTYTDIATKSEVTGNMTSIPAIRSKGRVFEALDNIYNASDSKQAAAERQRAAAARLTKGYSVVSNKVYADKENVKEMGKVSLKPNGGKENIMRDSGKSGLSNYGKENSKLIGTLRTSIAAPKWNKFQLPVKPAKSKKIDPALKKSESVVSLPSISEVKIPTNCDDGVSALEIPLQSVVIDHDKKYEHDELLLGIYAKNIYKYLRQLESEQSVREGYLTKSHLVSESMRGVLVDWLYEVQHSFDLLLDTVQMAVGLLDRFLQDATDISRDNLQLVGVTCLFIASKYEEVYPPGVNELVDVSAKAFTKQHILKMEKNIFKKLKYNIGRPSPLQFLRRFSRAGHIDNLTYTLSKYFVDLALVQYSFSHYSPSLLSAAALYLSLSLMKSEEEFWTPTLAFYTEYSSKTLTPIVLLMAKLVLQAPKLKQQCVQLMYSNPKSLNVTRHAESMTEKLKERALLS